MDEGNPKASVLYIVSDSPLNSRFRIQFSRIQNPLKLSRKEKKMEWNTKQDEYDFRKLLSLVYICMFMSVGIHNFMNTYVLI